MTQPFVYSLFSKQLYYSLTQSKASPLRLAKYCKRYDQFVVMASSKSNSISFTEIDYNKYSKIFFKEIQLFLDKIVKM